MLKSKIVSYILCAAFLIGVFSGCKNTSNNNTALQEDKLPAAEESSGGDTKTVQAGIDERPLLGKYIRNEVSVPYNASIYQIKLKPYKVNEDLSNIENLEQFGSFSEGQKKLLSQNAFVVSPATEEQLFYIYEKNSYLKIPSFITTDSVLQVYHIFYDYSLRNLETSKLIKAAEDLTESMLKKSIDNYNSIKNPVVKKAALLNVAYFGVASLALQKELPDGMPDEAEKLAQREYTLIQNKGGFRQSAIFPYMIDYSQFEPRGHYTRSDDFKRYFIAMSWYGQAPLPLYKDKEQKVRNVEQTLQALLMTYTLFQEKQGEQDIDIWEKIYEPTTFYVGKSDDLTIYNYRELLVKAYGENPDMESLDEESKLDIVYEEAKKLPEPQIKAKYLDVTTPVGKQMRFMGQRYIPDSEIIQELVEIIERWKPSGLDVMGVLGSERAYDITLNDEDNYWDGYPQAFSKMKDKFTKLPEETWRSNMYYGWLWVLKSFAGTFGEGYPSFMTNAAWVDKSLSTALGSWSELRHDTILYGKQSGAEKGGGEEPKILNYVEPAVEVYDKLLWLTTYSRENLSKRGILNENVENAIDRFENLLTFLRDCSIKELKGEDLSDEDNMRLYNYGAWMEDLTASLASDGLRWFEIESETDKNMALIADFHTIAPNRYDNGGFMEAGVGPAHEIYVVVPIGGKLYLTRGAVFSYYEFESDKRLTDEEWQKMLKENKAPKQPYWTETFIQGGKGKIPEPVIPYNQ